MQFGTIKPSCGAFPSLCNVFKYPVLLYPVAVIYINIVESTKKEKWLRKYLELPYGIPTDDTFRIVIGNIDKGYFFNVTVQLLLQTAEVKK